MNPLFFFRRKPKNQILCGKALDVLQGLPSGSCQMCVTSPPYWGLRDYGCDGQLGLERTPEEYISKMVEVFREVRRVLKDDGTLWLNIGDTYAANRGYQVPDSKHVDVGNSIGMKAIDFGLKPKDLVGIPWMLAFALRSDGWYLRQDIIWHKPNPMPESVRDRCTKAHEYLFLLSKSQKYFYDADAVREPGGDYGNRKPKTSRDNTGFDAGQKWNAHRTYSGTHELGRNRRSVWTIATQPFPEAHFATFPEKLVEPCILAGSRPSDVVLDPFGGSGTTGKGAGKLGRRWILIDLNPSYVQMIERRTGCTSF